MHPVFINNTQQGLGFAEFKKKMVEICMQHQSSNRSSAFAFIIYDFDNEHVRKILFDIIYWDSLDHISGKYLTIFSLFDIPTKQSLEINSRQWSRPASFNAHKVYTNDNISSSYREIVDSFFGGISFKTPSILFFQVDKDVVIDYFLVELKEQKIEEGFLEIKRLITESVDAIKLISKENIQNHKEIFDMLKTSTKSSVWWTNAKKIGKKGIDLISFLSIFK